MSGGVDSSLVAALMAERGCAVTGATMQVYDGSIAFPPGAGNGCYGPDEPEDEAACRDLCAKLGADYRVVNLAPAYRREVLDYFKSEYRAGRTPNPCLRCNPVVKFGLLPAALRASGVEFDYFATGHYARLLAPGGEGGNGVYLAPGLDAAKDQSYFLQRLGQDVLRTVRFPLGEMTKSQTREAARRFGLAVAEKPDSQDFVASEDYDLLFADAPSRPGDIVDRTGKKVGEHRGLVRYTIGQRRGLGVSLGPEAVYVTALDAARNRVVVGPEAELLSAGLEADDAVWAPGFGLEPFRAFVKIRLAAPPAPASVVPLAGGRVRVEFDAPQRAVAPGQSAAFYVPIDGAAVRAAVRADDRSAEPAPGAAVASAGGRRSIAATVLAGGAVIASERSH
jgi:tRNA-specific 2-thiouridylase